jgi:hypothetical protein
LNGAEARNLFTGSDGEGTDSVDVDVPKGALSGFDTSSAAVVIRVFCEADCVRKESLGREESFWPESVGSGFTEFGGADIVKYPANGAVKKGRGGLGVRRGSQRPEAYAIIKVAQSQSDRFVGGDPSTLGEGGSSSASWLKGEGKDPK